MGVGFLSSVGVSFGDVDFFFSFRSFFDSGALFCGIGKDRYGRTVTGSGREVEWFVLGCRRRVSCFIRVFLDGVNCRVFFFVGVLIVGFVLLGGMFCSIELVVSYMLAFLRLGTFEELAFYLGFFFV